MFRNVTFQSTECKAYGSHKYIFARENFTKTDQIRILQVLEIRSCRAIEYPWIIISVLLFRSEFK